MNTNLIGFEAFPKIPRLARRVIVTEKIDGTNAQIFITAGEMMHDDPMVIARMDQQSGPPLVMYAGSRSRWIIPSDDNYGFALWAQQNAEQLFELGEGRHFGEWWGSGIQRRYGLDEKRFSLFNASRWSGSRPSCCHVVPVLWAGQNDDFKPSAILDDLRDNGSRAAPGFMKPEGIVVFHTAAGTLTKKTIEKDHEPKGTP